MANIYMIYAERLLCVGELEEQRNTAAGLNLMYTDNVNFV